MMLFVPRTVRCLQVVPRSLDCGKMTMSEGSQYDHDHVVKSTYSNMSR